MHSQEVLLLHEVGALVKFIGPDVCEPVCQVVMPKVREELYQRSNVFFLPGAGTFFDEQGVP